MFKPYDDVAKRIDRDIEKIDKEIEKLTNEKERLVQAKALLTGQQKLPLSKEQSSMDDEQKKKLKQAALLRHKKEREQKAKEIAEILREKGDMGTKDISEAMNRSRGSILRILKECNFQKTETGLWTVKNSEN